ncbi:MAG: hypothetical protein K9M45_09850, partial [Kiritimatiellales bacterium]|nr:hypothetical protein [Kiritimatiellales bacterium]
MCPATSDFEELRQQIFAHHAEAFLNRIDPDTGLLRVRPWRGSEKSMHSRAAGVDVRSTASAMTAWAMTGHDELAWKSLAYVLDHQDLDTDSLTYGNFKWHSEWPMALDPNALSFIIPHLWYVHRHASSRMPADLHERLQKCLRLAFDAANAHRCTIAYTNIVLLNQAARLCIADALDWPRARAVAGWEWEEWRNFVNRTGFLPEYNSPAYTGVQLEALAVMLACPASPELHAEIRTVIRHLIAESVSNYHAGIGMVTGPQSRGAYRLRGHTLMDTIYHFVLGTPEPTDGCHIWLGVPIGPDDLLSHVRELKLPRTTRTQTHRFRRQNYLAPDFALGSIDGEVHTTAHNTPFHLAFRTPQTSCAWPMV